MILKLFTLPITGIIKVAEIIQDEAESEMYDLDRIQRELLQLQVMYEMGEVPEEDYLELEEELIERFELAKRRELGELGQWDDED
jgi:hypothetical protein